MTNALRITSITVAAAAVLLVALPVLFSSDMDEQTASLLGSPGVLESLNKSAAAADTGAVSPLVQQAEKFAAYLNPPPQKREKTVPIRNNRTPIRPTSPVTAKFELLGTSYYPDRPELSLALIDEPGSGLRWIRQSSKIGHLIVEQVMDGKVAIRDGTNTYELEPKRIPKRSLVKGESSYSAESSSSGPLYTELPESRADSPQSPREAVSSPRPRYPTTRINTRNNRGRTADVTHRSITDDADGLSDVQAALFDQFAREVDDINDPNEWMERADKLMERLAEASQVTNEEAELLDVLANELQDANEQ